MSPLATPSPHVRFPGLPDQLLERYLCGELPAAEAARVEAAAERLPELAQHLAERRRDKAAFAAVRPFGPVAARIEAARAPSRLRRLWPAALLAPALATALLLLLLRPDAALTGDTLRVRGGVKAGLVVKRGAAVFPQEPGVALRPGDQVRVQVEDPRGGHLWVLALGDRGALHRLYGFTEVGGPLRMAPGALTLPGSLVLDASPEREALYVLLSDAPLAEADVTRWLQDAARGSTFPPRPPAPAGTRYAVLELAKEVQP
jgi:hypothetical protein